MDLCGHIGGLFDQQDKTKASFLDAKLSNLTKKIQH